MQGDKKKVTVIPATLSRFAERPLASARKRRTAAYARVSTDSEEQLSSYNAQVSYYSGYIKSKPEWEFVEVYTDEGVTGTSTKHRDGFQRMIADALSGRIDLIITKSVSRFARNTVDSLTNIRLLKEHHVEVYFEKENIWTFDSKGEVLLTIMSSLAQEESRSISESVTWGIRKRFADGKICVPYSSLLGYDKGPGGSLVINEDQAAAVRYIFSRFLSGISPGRIAAELTSRGIRTARGKAEWSKQGVLGILRNEKYKGDAILQKTYTPDFLTKKAKANHGEVPKYLIENSHPAIVSREQFDAAQALIAGMGKDDRHGGGQPFSGMVRCGSCGSLFGPKVWHSNDRYRTTIWQCIHKFSNEVKCTTPHLSEDALEDAYLDAANQLIGRSAVSAGFLDPAMAGIAGWKGLESECRESECRLAVLREEASAICAAPILTLEATAEYEGILSQMAECRKAISETAARILEAKKRKVEIEAFMESLAQQDRIHCFEESQFRALVDHITVYSRTDIRVTFKNGMEIKCR